MSLQDIDKRIDWKTFYAQWLQLKGTTVNMSAKCPFQQHKQPSFSVNIETGLWKCHSCEEEGNAQTFIQKHLGISKQEALELLKKEAGISEDKPKKTKFTVSDYSRVKKLPENFLKDLGLKDGKIGITIPYFDESGAVVANRQRYGAAATGPRFTWSRGSKVMFYGLWRLKEAREAGYVVLVEGESDAQTLWLHGIPCQGIPGATVFRSEWVQYITGLKIYLHQEPDAGGETFVKKVCESLVQARWEGEVYSFTLPGKKDPSELHCADPEQFMTKWSAALAGARPLDVNSLVVKPEEVLPGAPIQLRMPSGWRVNEKGVFMVKEDGLINICSMPILLSRQLCSIDTGEEKIEIAFRKDNNWRRVVAQRSTVFQARSITMLADRGLSITSEKSRKMVQFLGDMEDENHDLIPVVKSTSHMGWVGSGKFIPGMPGDIVLDVDTSSMSAVNAFHESGQFEVWRNEIAKYRQFPIARFLLAAGFASPMLEPLKHRVFAIHSWSDSRGGKTAILKAAMSIWGEPESLMVSFNATKVGLERTASLYTNIPLGVNERQAASDKQKFIESLIYMLGEGKGKTRGAKGGGLQETKSWRMIVISTGEEPLASEVSHTGITTRVIELWGEPIPDEKEARRLHGIVDTNYGFAGPMFIIKLINEIKSGDLKTNYEAFKDYLEERYSDKLGSHVTAVALTCLADYYASQWIFSISEEEAYGQAIELASVTMDKNETIEASDYANRAIEWLESWVTQHRANFSTNTLDRYGEIRREIGEVYILPSVLEPALKEAGFVPRRVYQDLFSKGYIKTDKDKKRYKKTVRIEGQLVKVFALKLTKSIESYEE